ncbi:MAG: S8 family serine peptidase [Planctomycetota bacterium]|jgi:subtilisin family serine protease
MSLLSRLSRLCIVGLGLFAAVQATEPNIVFGDEAAPGTRAERAKIDDGVERRMARGERVPVLVLATDQLLPEPSSYVAFQREHAHARRLDLRTGVVTKLKDLAASQNEVIEALGVAEGVERLWIVNAFQATLTPEQILLAARHESVKYVYPGARQRRRAGRGPRGVEEVLEEEAEREPFTSEGKTVPWNLQKIGAPKVWGAGITGEGAVVAVLDAGVNYRHADLRDNVWRNSKEVPNNGKDDDGNGLVDDLYGYDFSRNTPAVLPRAAEPKRGLVKEHGTWTSGIVAGDGTGGTVTGVAPRARLMVLKAGGFLRVARAYEYAIVEGADVISMSFSVPNLGDARGLWRLMSEHAVLAGLVQVSGAGNFQQSEEVPTQIRIPEGIPSVICAGGIDERGELPRFVSMGPVEWGTVKFYGDFALPGGLIKPDVVAFPGPRYPVLLGGQNEGYLDPNNRVQGNSFSGPHVAGVAALMFSANPELPAWRVQELLEQSARDLGAPGKDNRTGAGLIRAELAVRAARLAAPKGDF